MEGQQLLVVSRQGYILLSIGDQNVLGVAHITLPGRKLLQVVTSYNVFALDEASEALKTQPTFEFILSSYCEPDYSLPLTNVKQFVRSCFRPLYAVLSKCAIEFEQSQGGEAVTIMPCETRYQYSYCKEAYVLLLRGGSQLAAFGYQEFMKQDSYANRCAALWATIQRCRLMRELPPDSPSPMVADQQLTAQKTYPSGRNHAAIEMPIPPLI